SSPSSRSARAARCRRPSSSGSCPSPCARPPPSTSPPCRRRFAAARSSPDAPLLAGPSPRRLPRGTMPSLGAPPRPLPCPPRMRSDAIKPGDVIAGKYRVRAIMGRSRGFLVDALHNEFDQRLAIRVLPPQLVDPRQVERFHREVQTLARLASEHAARIFDAGTLPDGAFYFARQYLDGKDLAAHLQQRGALTVPEAVLFILQAAEAVAETHAYGIV